MLENNLPAEAITDPKTFANDDKLHGMLKRLRREDPFPYVQADDHIPFWLATRHATISEIELNPTRFISAPRQALFSISHQTRSNQLAGGNAQQKMRNVTAMDGEEHRVYRAIAQSRFFPTALGRIRGDVEKIAAEYVGRMNTSGSQCDFALDIALGYPLRVIMSLLGVPPEDEGLMLRLTQQLLTSQDKEFNGPDANPIAAMTEMYAYFKPIIEDRRKNPTDDIASCIATAKVDGEYLAERDVFGYFMIVATAGHDTTSYSLTGGLKAFLDFPDQLTKLRADPSLMSTAVEEMIRWATPVKHFVRTATEDCIVEGKQVRAGDTVLLCYPSANRDKTVFDDPFAFRIDRKPNRHLAFGIGPHACLGQHLARIELHCFMSELLKRIDNIEQTGEARRVESTFVGGVKNLPIRYTVKSAAA